MPDPAPEPALTDPARTLPADPEAPDAAEPPGAEGLRATARVSYERTAEAVGSTPRKARPQEP